MEKQVEIFKCTISNSSIKSLVPLLHEFTIQNFDLFFPFFGKLNLLNSTVYLLTCQYFERIEKILSRQKVGVHFADFFIVRVKTVCYERKVQGELLGYFLHCTLGHLHPYVPTKSFRLMALWNKIECQCYNETNIPSC